jgi:transposase InsO family protein
VFETCGLPDAMITGNGNPRGQQNGPTRLPVRLIRFGIEPLWSRPRHPQTMRKIERLHRTMKAERLQRRRFLGFEPAQAGLEGVASTMLARREQPSAEAGVHHVWLSR